MKETWKTISGYEGRYEVSDMGNVKSLSFPENGYVERIRKNTINNCGYVCVNLCKDGRVKRELLHRLVAIAFIPNINNKPQVNHINGNKTDNRIENLEWNTRSENVRHSIKTGLKRDFGKGRICSETHKNNLSKSLKGRKSPCGMSGKRWSEETRIKIIEANTGKSRNKGKIAYQYPVIQLDLDGNYIKEWCSATMAAKELNLRSSLISACCHKNRNKTGGYKWKFKTK